MSRTSCCTATSRTSRRPSRSSTVTLSPTRSPSLSARRSLSSSPCAGGSASRPSTSITRCRLVRRRAALDHPGLAARAVDEAHGHAPPGLDLQHAGQARQGAGGARVDGVDRPHLDVAAHAQVEVGVDDDVDGIAEEVAHDDDRHRGGDAAHRDRRAQRAALHVAQDHAQRRAGAQARDALEQRAPVAAGRGRAHGLGRLQPHRRGDGGERAQQGGDRHDAQAHGHELGGHRPCTNTGKRKTSSYRPISSRPSHLRQRQAQQPAAGGHGRDQLEVVQGDGAVGIPQRLERRDLLALGRDQPRRDDMQQERGHRQEDRRAAPCPAPAARGSRRRAWRATSGRRGRSPAGRRSARAAGSRHRSVAGCEVPGASLIATRLKAPCMSSAAASSSASSQNTPKARTSGMPHMPAKMYSGDSTVPVMRRRRSLPLTRAVTLEPGVSLCACANTSVTTASSSPPARAARLGQAARPQRHAVQALRLAAVQADQLADHRVGAVRHRDARAGLDGRLDVDHARQLGQPPRLGIGCALDAGEDVGEAAGLVEALARERQRLDGRQAADEAADAAGRPPARW